MAGKIPIRVTNQVEKSPSREKRLAPAYSPSLVRIGKFELRQIGLRFDQPLAIEETAIRARPPCGVHSAREDVAEIVQPKWRATALAPPRCRR